MADEIDYEAVAEVTGGMSGAELANVLDRAALKVLRHGGTEVGQPGSRLQWLLASSRRLDMKMPEQHSDQLLEQCPRTFSLVVRLVIYRE